MDVIKHADKLKNVTEAARIFGVSRQTIYRNKKILKERGPQGLKRTFRKNHYHKNRASSDLEKLLFILLISKLSVIFINYLISLD